MRLTGMPEQTEAGLSLLTFMREAFGEGLSALLLSGYGEQGRVRCRRYVLRLPNKGRRKCQRYVRVAATHNSYLPSGCDPLVLSALLKMLLEDGETEARTVLYAHENILKLLGWPDSVKTRLAVDKAVARYFNLYYQPVETLSELAGKTSPRIIHRECLVSQYGFYSDPDAIGSPITKVCNLVSFNFHLVEQLKRRSLFAIDWRRVRSLSTYP